MIENQQPLALYGWDEQWASAWSGEGPGFTGFAPGRVMAQFGHAYRIATGTGERMAEVTGRFAYAAQAAVAYPAVGDWVAAELLDDRQALIHAVLPRRTAMTRKAAGPTVEEQVIGANLDDLFIVNALNGDYNVRKIERYLIMAWESGARPVIVLTKADLCEETDERIRETEAAAPGVPVHAVSVLENRGTDALLPYLVPGRTIAVVGSSGAGKSTLLNWFAGTDVQRVNAVRESDARGRHTTTHRELFALPGGGLLMDTPGMRELQLWDARDGWQEAFSDIAELAGACRFRDCRHDREAGCAVKAAIAEGRLDPGRLANFRKTERELAYAVRKEKSAEFRRSASGGKAGGYSRKRTPRGGDYEDV